MSVLHTTQRIGVAAAGSVTLAREAQRLDSWKEIAAYFGRSTRCVQRWESKEGLPIHRHEHSRRSSIFAFDFVKMSGNTAKHFRLGTTNWTW
jgi:hypothetical protein